MTLSEEEKYQQCMQIKKAMIDDKKHAFHNGIKARKGVEW